MPFEFKIKRKLHFQTEILNKASQDDIIQMLSFYMKNKENLDIGIDGNTITSHTNKSVLYYEYKAKFIIEKKENLTVWYEYNLIPVFKITVIMILFAAFFSKFSFNNLLIFSGVFIVVFFGFNIMYINSVLKNMIQNALFPEGVNYEEKLTEEQQEWIKNPEKCPACGAEISQYNFECSECGLSINKKNRKRNINLSGFYNTKIKYKLTKSKKKKE